MKKILIRFVWFVLPLLIIIFGSLLFVNNTFRFLPSDLYYYNEFNKVFTEKDYDLVAIGNSKLLASIDKSALSKELNLKSAILGYSSGNISISKLTLESYLNNCTKKPKVILLEVSWFTFNNKRTGFHNFAGELFLNDFKLWCHINKYYPDIKNKITQRFFRQMLAKVCPEKEVSYKTKSHSGKLKFSLHEFEQLFPDHYAGIDSSLFEDYNSIVEMCRENHIQLILYTSPESEKYVRNQKDREKIIRIFEKTPDVLYFNYAFYGSHWENKFEQWLIDSHHLAESYQFTEILSKDIKPNLLLK